jgi:putative peptidoglycan lipid II flippase
MIAPDLVRLLLQRGAFNPDASAEVSYVLRFALIQLPPYFAGIALVQWYAATAQFRAILIINACALLFKVVLNVTLVPVLGLGGIMLATAGMYTLTSILLVTGARDLRKPAVDESY